MTRVRLRQPVLGLPDNARCPLATGLPVRGPGGEVVGQVIAARVVEAGWIEIDAEIEAELVDTPFRPGDVSVVEGSKNRVTVTVEPRG